MSNKILVTGALGFIGSYVAKHFASIGYEIYGIGHGYIDSFYYGKYGLSEWKSADITVESLYDFGQEFYAIVHCAGNGSVDFSIKNPYEDYQRNVGSTLEILEYIRLYNKNAKLIYPSSPAVCGQQSDTLISEDCKEAPCSPYGHNKKIAEFLCQSYALRYDLRITIVRLFSVYGNHLRKQLIWDACNKLSNNDSRQVVFFGDGKETRDFVHILDVANLFEILLTLEHSFLIINAGSGEKVTIENLLSKINKFFNKEVIFNNIIHDGNPRHYWADITLAKSFNWIPQIAIDDGIADYIQWFKSQ